MYMKSEFRDKREVVYTGTLFLNDNEPGHVDFEVRGMKIQLTIVMLALENIDKPTIDIEKLGKKIKLQFNGWNRPLVYSALEPITVLKFAVYDLSFSVCNTYLNGTNKIEMQFYLNDI